MRGILDLDRAFGHPVTFKRITANPSRIPELVPLHSHPDFRRSQSDCGERLEQWSLNDSDSAQEWSLEDIDWRTKNAKLSFDFFFPTLWMKLAHDAGWVGRGRLKSNRTK